MAPNTLVIGVIEASGEAKTAGIEFERTSSCLPGSQGTPFVVTVEVGPRSATQVMAPPPAPRTIDLDDESNRQTITAAVGQRIVLTNKLSSGSIYHMFDTTPELKRIHAKEWPAAAKETRVVGVIEAVQAGKTANIRLERCSSCLPGTAGNLVQLRVEVQPLAN